MKNIYYYSPSELEYHIEKWVKYYNDERYHEAIGNITPRDKYHGLKEEIFEKRREVKKETMQIRRRRYFKNKDFVLQLN